MALIVFAVEPRGLLDAIQSAVENGTVETWLRDSAGDYTYTPPQWKSKAWMRPHRYDDRVEFGIVGRKNEKLSKSVYAVYHGRFAEMLLRYFDTDISKIELTAQAANADIF